MNLIDFAAMLDGRENGYPQFSDEELKIAKENNIVIVTGASDDLVELEWRSQSAGSTSLR